MEPGHSTILIVDDEPSGRDLLKRLLSVEGYQLALASSGPEALTKAAELTPDLILLDVMMPDMDGFEVCRRLRSDPLLAEVPIIIVTALDDNEARLQGLRIGADDFVTKPFDQIELQARVRTITRLNRYRRLLSERAQREQAEEAERLKDQLISNISHELRTPLSVIALLSGNLDTLYEHLGDDKRRQMIRDIRKHTKLLTELVESVLEISRLESERVPLEPQPLDLAQLIRQELNEQRPLARQKSQTLHLTGVEHLTVRGSRSQVCQVMRNLLNNAIKYTPHRGQITCECLRLTTPLAGTGAGDGDWPGSSDLGPGRWAALRIIDTGPGIDPQDIPHLFERFYRVKSQGNIPGSGLGLSIARELVEAQAGHIAVSSTPGRGSMFAMYLPLLTEDGKG